MLPEHSNIVNIGDFQNHQNRAIKRLHFENTNIANFPRLETFQDATLNYQSLENNITKEQVVGAVVLIGGLYFIYKGGMYLADNDYVAGAAMIVIGAILAKKGLDLVLEKPKGMPSNPNLSTTSSHSTLGFHEIPPEFRNFRKV